MARGFSWETEEEALLRQHYPSGGTKRVARVLPFRTFSAIKARAVLLKIRFLRHNSPKAIG